MRTARAWASIGLMLLPPAGVADSVFEGTWRPDPQIYGPDRKPEAVELANGIYECPSCTPAYKVKADGLDQPISGNPFYDTISIAIIDQRTVMKTAKKDRKTVMQTKLVVAADGATETARQTLYETPRYPIELTARYIRVSGGSTGSHAISGAWRMTQMDVSNHAEDTLFKVSGDMFSMSDRMGRSFTAKLDGPEAPYQGSGEFTSVTLRKIDGRTIEETDKKAGNVVKITRWSVAEDGNTMHVRFDDTKGFVQEQTGHKVR